MVIRRTPRFKKQYQKLPPRMQQKFDERLLLFVTDPFNPQLRVHPLKAQYAGYWSIDITGDLRALFRREGDEVIIFGFIGTHSQLYG